MKLSGKDFESDTEASHQGGQVWSDFELLIAASGMALRATVVSS